MEDCPQCPTCGKSFNYKRNLEAHRRKFHGDVVAAAPAPKMVCAACSSAFQRIEELEAHLRDEHDFTTAVEYKTFQSETAFLQWKRDTECASPVKFIVRNSVKSPNGNRLVYYRCNRSGPVKLLHPDCRKREVKSQGSCKTNAHCPARITASFFPDGSVEACICLSHFGHSLEVAHVPLPYTTKKAIAAKIASRVPFDRILEDVRNSLTGELTRNHLVNQQDLKNIMRDFKLDSNYKPRHSHDAASVDGWVQQEFKSQGDESSVILYKAKGVDSPGNHDMETSEFLLGIMSPAQGDMLKKFGADVVCMDSTHGTAGYGYEMTTLLVLDENGEVFPCAFFISERDNRTGIEIFLKAVKDKVGNITAKIFMSDVTESGYNVWKAVMAPAVQKVYSSWHVLRAWKDRISSLKKEKRDDVTKQVRDLLHETDMDAFKTKLPSTVESLCSDPDTASFGEYFKTYCSSNSCYSCEKWAYCFRTHEVINNGVALERMHGVLERVFLGEKVTKRMDKTINALMRLVNDKLFNKLIALDKEKVSNKIRELHKRHETATQMSFSNILPNSDTQVLSWTVKSSSRMDSYVVSFFREQCDCAVRCEYCNACFHKLACTCIDYCLKSVMCKHVHLLCLFLKNEREKRTDDIDEPDQNSVDFADSPVDEEPQHMSSNKEHEPMILAEQPSRTRYDYSMSEQKDNIKSDYFGLIDDCKSQAELDIMKHMFRTTQAKLEAVRKNNVNFETKGKK